jgi:hypothetical protein
LPPELPADGEEELVEEEDGPEDENIRPKRKKKFMRGPPTRFVSKQVREGREMIMISNSNHLLAKSAEVTY